MEQPNQEQVISGIQTEQEYCKLFKVLTKKFGLEVAGLYGYLVDKRSLSIKTTRDSEKKENYLDNLGFYCVVTYEELEEELRMTEYKIKKNKRILRDLGLITEVRQLDEGNKIYVWDISADWKYEYGRKSPIV